MQDLKLIPAHEKDIPAIAELAGIIWNQHYPAIIGQEQVDYMLEMMYSRKSLKEQIEKGHRFYLISFKKENIGFISVSETSKDEWFINKFYIDQTLSARGLGTLSFGLLMHLLNARKVSLTVNRRNYKSINFYFKNGFKIQEVKDIDIGNGFVMEDFVMVWKA